MNVKRRVEQLEKAGYGAKPAFAVAFQKYINRERTNAKGDTEEFVDAGPIVFTVPDGPLGSGKELHIEKTELTEEFRSRIREPICRATSIRASIIVRPSRFAKDQIGHHQSHLRRQVPLTISHRQSPLLLTSRVRNHVHCDVTATLLCRYARTHDSCPIMWRGRRDHKRRRAMQKVIASEMGKA